VVKDRRDVERRADAAGAAAGDKDSGRVWDVGERPVHRRVGVVPAALLDGDRTVAHPPVAEVDVAAAGWDEDPAPVSEGLRGSVMASIPPAWAGSSASVTESSNQVLPTSQERSSKQPPPWKNTTGLLGSATRAQNA
jgi:hypothetical protein